MFCVIFIRNNSNVCYCTYVVAPAVAELATHANWAQEFLANERSQPAADFDAVVPHITPSGKAQAMSGPLVPRQHMMGPRLHMQPHW